ncbi:MAG: DegQ family serine endoprotease [Gammaproteobacteria bacterium]|nr:DegQ family serine endoprotease [Gammaproteobacteria bacterium]
MFPMNRLKAIAAGLLPAIVFLLPVAAPGADGFPRVNGIPTLAPVLKKVIPAVVNISTEKTVLVRRRGFPFQNDPFFRRFFDGAPGGRDGDTREQRRSGIGSGVIIDADEGYVITNNHVIDGADDVYVTLGDGRRFEAEVVGTDPETDVAVIRIEADDLVEIPLGDSENLQVGDFAVAIGNPFRLGQTVTLGIISALGRSGLGIESYEDFIQTDASINPGNSGGALINMKGELVGINTAIIGPNANIGIGFAIPVNMAMNVTGQLIKHGEVRRGRLGVVVQPLTADLAQAFGLDSRKGAVIVEVEPESPADEAGLMPGDVVLSVDDEPIDSSANMRNYIGLLRVGSKVKLDILRDGREKTLTAVIVARKLVATEGGRIDRRLGGAKLVVQEETETARAGVLIKEVAQGSPARRNGLRSGDLILSVNRRRVKNIEQIRDLVEKGRPILLNMLRGKRAMFLALRP